MEPGLVISQDIKCYLRDIVDNCYTFSIYIVGLVGMLWIQTSSWIILIYVLLTLIVIFYAFLCSTLEHEYCMRAVEPFIFATLIVVSFAILARSAKKYNV